MLLNSLFGVAKFFSLAKKKNKSHFKGDSWNAMGVYIRKTLIQTAEISLKNATLCKLKSKKR